MKKIQYRLIKAGAGLNGMVPLNLALVDKKDLDAAGVSGDAMIRAIAADLKAPVTVNIFDMDAVTTTSDGIMVEGAIVKMGAGDMGKVHKEFGILDMAPMEVTPELIAEEPHLKQWTANFEGRRLFRGPDPAKKLIPVHNVVMTGRAVNNNSATEMMNSVTMEEILFPILGQLELMRDHAVVMGLTGEVISVGIGMTVAEKFGRVFPTRQFGAGDTAHGSGEYAKTLKKSIPIIAATKAALAENFIRALEAGMVPGRDIGCSPAVLAVAREMGAPVDVENITAAAREELKSVGVDVTEFSEKPARRLSNEEIIAQADSIIPGIEGMQKLEADALVTSMTVSVAEEEVMA
uniref:hypothetical protein n=1 Tax=Ndongobacter massiliensis TaxID=1871025 RepID=UPI000931DD2F|nr:hypothetical protein [Ndongobacter massiliensis]